MKKLTTETGIALMVDIIGKDKRHRDYKRVCDMADKMKMLITGEDMESLMRQFDRRESKKQFEQRVDITQHITSTVSKNLMKPQKKIPRSNGVRRILKYINDNENQKLNELNAIIGKFWGNKSLDKYLNGQWIELTNLDPNSFIVYEWGDFDAKTERAKPYPFEVSSKEAIYYQYENNVLQYLMVMNEFEKGAGGIPEKIQDDNEGKKVTRRYTLYFEGYSIVLDEIDDDDEMLKPFRSREIWEKGTEYLEIKGRVYHVLIFTSGLDFIPVARVGFEYDPMTRGRTCIPPIWDAVPILMKTIKANSELDLTMALHAHPQKLQYVRQCQAEHCTQGRMPTGEKCGSCSGTGREKVSTTAQEAIEMIMPRDKEDMVTLDNIVAYISPSVELIRFQDDYIKSLTAQCKEAIYNSEIFSRQQIAETATGKNIDLQNVYDALYPMAEAFSDIWEFSIYAITQITDKSVDLLYAYIFSKDFKMKSMSELIMDLKTVSDSKADAFVKQAIQDDIAQIVYTDDPTALERHKVKDRFYPYSGKTAEQIAGIVSTISATDFHKVLWESYGWVFEEIEREQTKKGINYYELVVTKQWSILEKKINAIIKEREAEPVPTIKEEVIVEE